MVWAGGLLSRSTVGISLSRWHSVSLCSGAVHCVRAFWSSATPIFDRCMRCVIVNSASQYLGGNQRRLSIPKLSAELSERRQEVMNDYSLRCIIR